MMHGCTVKQISDNEIYLLIKYIKSVLWKVAKSLSYREEARCLKVKMNRATGKVDGLKFYILYLHSRQNACYLQNDATRFTVSSLVLREFYFVDI